MNASRLPVFAAAAVVLASLAPAQDPQPGEIGVSTPVITDLVKKWGSLQTRISDEYYEVQIYGGFHIELADAQLEIRGSNVLMLLDIDTMQETRGKKQVGDLPRRGHLQPDPRRRLSNEQIRARLEGTLRAMGRSDGLPDSPLANKSLDLLRYIYCEGGVVVVRQGIEVIRCDRLWISPIDDRVVVENAELRYVTGDGAKGEVTIARAPRLTKQGRRWTGRDVTLTNCTAAVPHAAFVIDDAEIIEHENEFEIISRGATVQIGGTSLLPLPNTSVFTGSQSNFPVKRARIGYSNRLGMQAQVGFGQTWNGTGGVLHEWLTGRSANEFRGDWELGVGWIEKRGVPLDGVLNYQAAKLYRGSTEAFFLDDSGVNIREIVRDRSGSVIDTENRGLIRTQNRLLFGEKTTLDLVAYQMTDPSVWSEFYNGAFRTEEVPETSTYLHHADGNRLFTVGTRFNLNDFSYRDDRSLADRFIEEEPVATYQWLAQPIGLTPWRTPIIVDLETNVGQRRSNYDDLTPGTHVSDRTLRLDQLAELSAPLQISQVNVRPYVSGRGTWYDETQDGTAEGRAALETGVQLGSRMQRTWSWNSDGERRAVRHVMAPKLTYRNRFHVDDQPGAFYQFDATDQLTQQQLVRAELRNQLQKMELVDGVRQPRDFLFVDFAQDLFPDRARDNQGEALGLLYYDFLIRPSPTGLPVKNLTYAIYGDHDWKQGLRTLDTELGFGPVAGINWTVDYRTDRVVRGAVGVRATTQIFERWDLYAGSQRDLDRDTWLAYQFGIRRNDHDWTIEAGVVFNPFTEQTTFQLDFVPKMGGIDRPQRDRLGNGSLQSPLRSPH